jgi:ankyrin repeat protein
MRKTAMAAATADMLGMAPTAEASMSAKELFEAIAADDATVVAKLLAADPALLTARTPEGFTPIAAAAYRGRMQALDAVLARRGEPTLAEAAILGDLPAVERRLAAGDDVGALAPDGFTALGLAVFFGHLQAAKRLAAAGADVNQVAGNAQKVGPIHAAVARRDNAALKWLLRLGADSNQRQQGGHAPLHEAAAHGDAEAVEMLLAAGADPGARTDDGKTPSDFAAAAGQAELAARLRR